MRIHQFIADHSIALGFGASSSTAIAGVTVATINPYLQAGAFVVSIIVGVFTIADYIRKYKLRKRYDQQPKN